MKAILILAFTVFNFIGVTQNTLQEYVQTIPNNGFVSDNAQLFTDSSEQLLENKLSQINKKTGVQYAICTLNTLPNQFKIADVATELGNTWGVGNKAINNGVVMLFNKENSQVFIATGNGVKKYLPNNEVKTIIDSQIIPEFKKENYFTGTANAVDSLQVRLKDTPLSKTSKQKALMYSNISILVSFAFVIFGAVWLFNRRKKKQKTQFGGGSFSKGNGAGGEW